ncbi:MAG: hypothetical protein IKC07_02155 [Clostridia bacterium]|nr:hypothetical protein [Clostridia bacterium]
MPYEKNDLNKQSDAEITALKAQMAKDEIEIERQKNDELLKLRKNYNLSYIASLENLSKEEKKIMTALKAEIKDIYANLSQVAEENIESVLKSRDKLLKKLSDHKDYTHSHFNVYGGGENGGTLSYDMLNDYSVANRELMDYYKAISSVKERLNGSGFDSSLMSGFLSTLSDMSVTEGSKFLSLLLNSSDADFNRVVNGYSENQNLTKRISAELYSEDFTQAVDKTAAYMKAELESLGFEIPESFTLSGTISAENFGYAFIKGLEKQLESVRSMISAFSSSLATPSYSFNIQSNPATKAANVTYNQSFTVGSSKDSTFEQITAWKNATTQARLRGQ